MVVVTANALYKLVVMAMAGVTKTWVAVVRVLVVEVRVA